MPPLLDASLLRKGTQPFGNSQNVTIQATNIGSRHKLRGPMQWHTVPIGCHNKLVPIKTGGPFCPKTRLPSRSQGVEEGQLPPHWLPVWVDAKTGSTVGPPWADGAGLSGSPHVPHPGLSPAPCPTITPRIPPPWATPRTRRRLPPGLATAARPCLLNGSATCTPTPEGHRIPPRDHQEWGEEGNAAARTTLPVWATSYPTAGSPLLPPHGAAALLGGPSG